MRDVLGKMRECGKVPNLRDFPHDCGMVDTYAFVHLTDSPGFKRVAASYLHLFHLSNDDRMFGVCFD